MPLHPILNEKLNAAVLADLDLQTTRRDAVLAAVPGKVQAVIGMRRAGKTTFLRQLQGDWRTSAPAERVVYLSFDDDRLSDLPVEQLGLALEEYYRRYPELRGRETVWWLLDEIQLGSFCGTGEWSRRDAPGNSPRLTGLESRKNSVSIWASADFRKLRG